VSDAFPVDRAATATTAGRPRSILAWISRASACTSLPLAPCGATVPTYATPRRSFAPAASAAAWPSTIRARSFSISFSASRSAVTVCSTRSATLVAGHPEQLGEHVLLGQEAERIDARERLDTPDTGPDRRLGQDLDHAELPGPGHVRAAAQLSRIVADLDDPHLLAVFLAEERNRAEPARLLWGGDERVDHKALQKNLVDLLLDVVQQHGRDGPGVLKSKRRWPGAFSEPAWVADSPRKCRIVWWIRWVAVCEREIARRRVTSISVKPASPARTSPRSTRALVHDQARDRLLHVHGLELGAADPDHVGRTCRAAGTSGCPTAACRRPTWPW
jgi:hypothetical protein